MSRMCFNCMKMTEDGEFCAFCGKKLKTAPAHHLLPGTVLNGKYTVGYALGEGGFGVTYIGLDNSLQIKVAIKEFFPKGIVGRNASVTPDVTCLNVDESSKLFDTEKAKVINEARILAKFSKERGIVNVREYFEANNTAYIVMEYLEGETLEEYLMRSGPLSAEQAFTFLSPVMKVLGQLHEEKVVHRDISPDNLMFDGDQIKLLDFGAAREVLYSTSKSFSVILKHGYAPEEQYRRKGHQGPWTDVYSLCATIYYCITNVIPDTSLDRMHEDELKAPSDLGVAIAPSQEEALLRGLSVLPEDRLQSIADFIAAWNGESVPLPNPQKETIAAFKNDIVEKRERGNTTGTDPETIYGGKAQIVDFNSDERRVSGYYNEENAPVSEEPPKKKKKKIGIIWGAIAAFILVVAIIIAIVMLGGRQYSDNSKDSDTSGTHTSDTTSPVTEPDTESETEAETEPKVDPIEEAITKAMQKVEEDKFDEALAVLDTAEQLNGKSSKIETARKDIEKERALFNLNQYETSKDYSGAIKYYNNELSSFRNDEEVVEKVNIFIAEYRKEVLASAEANFKSANYAAAIDILNDALTVLPSDLQLAAKKTEYQEYLPVALKNLKVMRSSACEFEDSDKDPRGNINTDVLRVQDEIEFYTAGKYSKFTACLDPVAEFYTGMDGWWKVQIKIIADDEVVYTSPAINYKTDNLKIDVPIKNAEYLKIQVIPVDVTYTSKNLSVLLFDATVAK